MSVGWMTTKIGSQYKQSPEDNTGGGRTNTSASRYNHMRRGRVRQSAALAVALVARAHRKQPAGRWGACRVLLYRGGGGGSEPLSRTARPPADPPRVCHRPYNIGHGNIL